MKSPIDVFYHELGHFVAHELNKLCFGGYGVKQITITRSPYDQSQYEGDTVLVNPLNTSMQVPRSRLANHLVSLVYGCFFQAYRSTLDLNSCFGSNGINDANARRSAMNLHSLEPDKFNTLDDAFFALLQQNRALDSFLKLDANQYLCPTSDGYEVDLLRLRADTDRILTQHKGLYSQLIQAYNQII